MGASQKGKRKIVVNDTIFYWYVTWDEDWWLENIIHIFDDNKQHVFYYVVGKDEIRVLNKWVQSPIWIESDKLHDPKQAAAITPGIVAQIIKWCLENKENEQ